MSLPQTEKPRLFPELAAAVPAFAEAMRRHEDGDLAGARMMYANLIDQPALTAPCLHQLGLIAAAQGEHGRAADLFLKVTRMEPALWMGYANLSAALDRIGKPAEGTRVLADFASALYAMRQYKEAEPVFRQVLARDPASFAGNANLGTCLSWLGQLPEGAAFLIRALHLYGRTAPEIAGFLIALEADIDQSLLARIPPLPETSVSGGIEKVEDVLTSLGKALMELGQASAALQCYQMAVTIAPGFALGHWNLALALLKRGDFEQGWAEYEWRWEWPDFPEPRRRLPAAPWRGEPLAGKRILIWSEQGFGDILQFVPLVATVAKQKNAEVLLEVPAPLLRLLRANLPQIRVIPRPDQPNAVTTDLALDYALPILSLPLRLGLRTADLPLAAVPYLHPCPEDVALWTERLRGETRLRIGLVWASRPYPDTRRCIPLEMFRETISGTPNVAWYALQVGPQQRELDEAGIPGLTDLSADLHDFADTAAALGQLDLVISIDTAVAHLASALGKPVWTLLPCIADWRWGRTESPTPWYPHMRLFRQSRSGDWGEVLTQVLAALKEFPREVSQR